MIKTTKETHKQDEAFKSKVTFDSYDNVYANVDGEMKSLPDYIASKGSAPSNMMTTDTEQHITGHKYFTKLSISNESGNDNFDITTDIDTNVATNKVYFKREEASGYFRNEYAFSAGISSSRYFSLVSGDSNVYMYIYTNAFQEQPSYRLKFPNTNGTVLTDDNANALLETTLTLKTNQTYTCAYGKPYRGNNAHIIIRLINDGSVYTASFDITKGNLDDAGHTEVTGKVAFLMPYGTTSDDVATCFAYFDKDDYHGYLNIDLDNCQLSTGYSVSAYYYLYN